MDGLTHGWLRPTDQTKPNSGSPHAHARALQIKEGDDEKTKVKKRKLLKAHKSKARFAKLDQATKQKADAWKRFVSGKGGKKSKK